MGDLAHLTAMLVFVIALSACFAKVEIHIEGEAGWAASLPTWRIEKHWLLDLLFGGRPLTGYHAWVLPFSLGLFHFPILLWWHWSWSVEARILGCFMVFWICEDLLWFVLNPAWGLRRFNRREVRWHKHWLLGLPSDYWLFAAIAAALLGWSLRG